MTGNMEDQRNAIMNADTVQDNDVSFPPVIDDEDEDGALPSQPSTLANADGVPDSHSDSDADSDPETLRHGALPVARFPIGDPNLPPVNGEEYLRRVRAERNLLPAVIATSSDDANNNWADLDDLDAGDDCDDCDSNDPRPTKRRRIATSLSSSSSVPEPVSFPFTTTKTRVDRTWAQSILRDFDRLQSRLVARRQSLIPVGPAGIPMSVNIQKVARDMIPAEIGQQVPADLSEEQWRTFLYPSTFVPDASAGGSAEEQVELEEVGAGDTTDSLGRAAICRPIFLLSLTQRKLLALIRYHTAWIDTSVPRATLIDMAQVAYALLVGIDGDVLGMDGAGNVRELGKQCALVMSHVQQALDQSAQELDEDGEEGAVVDDEQEQEWAQGKEVCLALRIVLVIVSQKFGQRDLCELLD